eukprot:6175830-Pleurochrysis_carterae.AAC.1
MFSGREGAARSWRKDEGETGGVPVEREWYMGRAGRCDWGLLQRREWLSKRARVRLWARAPARGRLAGDRGRACVRARACACV